MHPRRPRCPQTSRAIGIKKGFRSGLEERISSELTECGISFEYEESHVPYTKPQQASRYTPDFKLLNNGIFVETKGIFIPADRKKHLLIREQHPELDIRFVFSNSRQTINKKSKTTYADWCNGNNPKKFVFRFADRSIPEEWFRE